MELTKELFEKMFLFGFTKYSMSVICETSEDAVDDFCRETYDMTFDELCYAVKYIGRKIKDSEKPYIVYMHIAPNGKKYIGVTKASLSRRWSAGNGYRQSPHFWSAIQKYGWDNFQHAVLYWRLSKEEAEEKERELIKRFKTTDREYGYNIEGGGFLNKEVSAETREKLKHRMTGKHASEETRKKMSESHSGTKCHFYGVPVTEETKAYLRKLRSKPVEQIDADGNIVNVYPSMKDAAKAFGVTRQAIASSARGVRSKAVGYYWRFANGDKGKAESRI